MSDIEFEADVQDTKGVNHYTSKSGSISGMQKGVPSVGGSDIGMVRWLVRHGIINSDSTAKAFLIGFIIVNFSITAFIMYFYVIRG